MITITIPLADYTYATHNSLPAIEPMEHYIAGRNMISMASYYTMENHLPSSLLLTYSFDDPYGESIPISTSTSDVSA